MSRQIVQHVQAQKTFTAANGRAFEGPFLILGIAPAWPQELERREDYQGPHTLLSSLRPIGAATPQVIEGKKEPEATRKPRDWVKVAPTHRKDLSVPLSLQFLDWLDRTVPFLSKARTVKQIARHLNCSGPTVYSILDVLQRRGFPLERHKRQGRRAAAWQLVPHTKEKPRARA